MIEKTGRTLITQESLFSHRYYRYERFSFCFFLETYGPVHQSEQRVVLTDPYVFARVVNRTALTHDDVPSLSHLTAKEFDAQTLAFRFAAVLRTTYTFLMCHCLLLLSV